MTHQFTYSLSKDQINGILDLYNHSSPVSIEQYPGFAAANADNSICHYIQVDDRGITTAYAQIDIRKFRIANIAFGPLASDGHAYKSAIIHVRSYCFQKLIPVLRIVPPYFISAYGDSFIEELKNAVSFEHSDKEINWSTLILNLEPSEDDILKGFADNHRQSVKKAVKLGLVANTIVSEDMIDLFSVQHSEMYEQRGLKTDRERNKIHFRKLFNFFEENSLGYFVNVTLEGIVIGGVCCAIQGDSARYLEGYSHPDYRKYPINHLALYEAMKIAKGRGLESFDLGGYANNIQEGDQLYAINKFKEAFRGKLVNYPKTMMLFILPLAKWMYNLRKR